MTKDDDTDKVQATSAHDTEVCSYHATAVIVILSDVRLNFSVMTP